MNNHLLSTVLFTPLAGMLILLLIPASQKNVIRLWANIAALAGFIVSLPLWFNFDRGNGGFQMVERMDWIPALGVKYNIGIDGISLLLVMLTTLTGFIAILSSWSAIESHTKSYYAMFLLQQTGMIGVFISLDFFLFYVFWELVLIPMYFIIGVWGGPRKLYAAIKFFLYTLTGSVLMLIGILTLYFQHYNQFKFFTFEISELLKLNLPLGIQQWVFWAFFIGFAIKVPMFPFHTWLPDAHVEAPTAGSVILASVLLKMGTYGFIRFSLPLLPKASIEPWIVQTMAVLSIVAIIYGALVSLMQEDWKKLVAYSSVSHLGFCTLGIFALNPNGIAGSVLQQINHGISTGMLFLVVGVVYERRHTRLIKEYGGLAHVMPNYAFVFAFAMLSSAGLPLLNGFVGEFTILQGVFEASRTWAAFAVTGVILGAAYLLWLYQRTMFGQITNAKNRYLPDLSLREWAVFLPLMVCAVWIGLYPKPFFEILDKPVTQLVERVRPGYLQGQGGPGSNQSARIPNEHTEPGGGPMSQFYTSTDHFVLVPAIMLALFGCAVLLFDFFIFPQPRQRKWLLLFLVLGELFTGAGLWRQQSFLSSQGLEELTGFQGSLTVDGFSLFFNWVFIAATLVVAIASYKYLEIEGEHHGEYYGLILLAQCGMFFLATGTDLVTLFIGLELMALCFYIMVGFLRAQKRSNEAAVKYLLLGAFSSGMMLYGFSLLYGISGSTKLSVIAQAVAAREQWDPILFLAIAATSVGLLFKISAAPFHMWAPDAYEGAPTTVTAYLAVGSKAASFAFLMRIFLGPLAPARPTWEPLLIAVALLSMTVGNIAAITQTNVKRLLAYSSISHAGYILLGLIAGNQTGLKGMAVYILVYAFMTLGAFIVVVSLRRRDLVGEDVDDMSGLMHKSPGHAVLMLIFLLSLAGIPPTAGFIGKYYIFLALLQRGYYVLAAVAALYVAVAIYYYFRIVRSMFVNEATDTPPLSSSFGLRVALAITGVFTLVMGVYPEPFLQLAQISLTR